MFANLRARLKDRKTGFETEILKQASAFIA